MGYDYHGRTLYELANEIFDEEVFYGASELLDAYNDRDDDAAREELFDIIGYMCHDAITAMRETVRKNKDGFLKVMEVQAWR